jgi:hypothetical protein
MEVNLSILAASDANREALARLSISAISLRTIGGPSLTVLACRQIPFMKELEKANDIFDHFTGVFCCQPSRRSRLPKVDRRFSQRITSGRPLSITARPVLALHFPGMSAAPGHD